MERIGITASKIAKGNLFVYNFYVVLISFLFSLFIFFIAGSSIALALIIIGYVINGVLPAGLEEGWGAIIKVCMVALTVVIGLFALFAIFRNVKFQIRQEDVSKK